jgi:phosphocarrier protein
VENTQKFKCSIYFEQGKTRINAKSILGIITLAAMYKSKIRITCDGPDEKAAMDCLVKLFESKFEEE